MHRLAILGALLLLQCGPKAPDADDDSTGAATTGATTDIAELTTTVADTTTAVPETTTTDPTTSSTTPGLCDGVDEGNVWVCRCDTNAGPWVPFNDACSRGPDDAIEWVEWLCEEYSDEPSATGGTTHGDAGSTAGGESAGDETADDTGSLGCMCTCEQTDECCDASLP